MTRRTHDLEKDHQRAFTEWAATQWWNSYYFHVPNERKSKIEAQILKGLGVKSGVPDIFIMLPVGEYHGLVIELKRKDGGRVSPSQRGWLNRLEDAGYCACVCAGIDEAMAFTKAYFE